MTHGVVTRIGCISAVVAGLCFPSHSQPQTVSSGRLNDVPILAPEGNPRALVIQFSDRSGWDRNDEATAQAIADEGAAVLMVDYAAYGEALDADGGECLYLGGELTDLAQKAQRSLGLETYMQPILVGREEGASLAFMALADAPANTFGGAIALGYRNALSLRLPICPGPLVAETEGNWRSYAVTSELPARAFVFPPNDAIDEMRASMAQLRTVNLAEQDEDAYLVQVASALRRLTASDLAFGDLPVVQLGAGGETGLILFVSGEGGWRDLDKTMGEWLAGQGYGVLGFDALAYFWRKRTPAEFAADLVRTIADADPKGERPVMLIGYSFGADALPLAWPLLPASLQARVGVIGLLAPSQSTSLEVTVTGWLGVEGEQQYDVESAIAALPPNKVLCIYGVDDATSSCPLEHLPADAVIQTKGGHHFDGDYGALAQAIVARFNAVRD